MVKSNFSNNTKHSTSKAFFLVIKQIFAIGALSFMSGNVTRLTSCKESFIYDVHKEKGGAHELLVKFADGSRDYQEQLMTSSGDVWLKLGGPGYRIRGSNFRLFVGMS